MNRNFLSLLLACLGAAGCATQVGKTSYPEPTANFSPKRSYSVRYTAAWEKVQQTLDEKRITIISANKTDTSGRIQTDYIAGPSYLIGGGLVAAQSTRYQYSITVRPKEGDEVTVAIVCKVESTMKGGSGASQWTDVSGQNDKLVANLENWLYEQIEKNF